MKNSLRVIALLAATFAMCGCSFYASFVVVNASEGVVTIRYEVQPTESIPYAAVRCEVTSIENFRTDEWKFANCEEGNFSFTDDRLSAIIRLHPGKVLRLAAYDIGDIAKEPTLKSGIRRISLTGVSGAVSYEDGQVFQHFVPGNKSWFPGAYHLYTISYK